MSLGDNWGVVLERGHKVADTHTSYLLGGTCIRYMRRQVETAETAAVIGVCIHRLVA